MSIFPASHLWCAGSFIHRLRDWTAGQVSWRAVEGLAETHRDKSRLEVFKVSDLTSFSLGNPLSRSMWKYWRAFEPRRLGSKALVVSWKTLFQGPIGWIPLRWKCPPRRGISFLHYILWPSQWWLRFIHLDISNIFWICAETVGNFISSQLTKSYFSEG